MIVSASIVTYNNSVDELRRVIKSLHESIVHKIYIIDNSPSSTIEDVVRLSSKIEYISMKENVGFGAGHNIAFRNSILLPSDFHIVVNPDVHFEPNIIEVLQRYMTNNANVGLMMPKIVYPNGEIQYLAKMLPAPLDWIGRRFIPFRKWVEERNYVYELRDSGYDKIMNVPYLSGCFMFLRTSVLEEVGLFDEGIFMYGEDTDLTRRIHAKYKTLFYPEVTVTHVHNKESYRNYRLLLIHIKAAIYYFNKWGWLFDRERKRINKQLKADYLTQ